MKRFTVLLVLFVFVGFALQAQGVQITGNVSSADDGAPLPGVSVVVKGTTVGTVTDINGDYTLSVPANATTLTFSFVGMQSKEVPISGQTKIDVTLESGVVGLDEVVVTALGIKRSEKAIGYASTTVGSDEINQTKSSDVVSALRGKVAGVQISNTSTDPGASNSVIIRGISSLNGNNQPLFVVDGVPITNNSVISADPLNNGFDFGNGANLINPEDVESMTILKGAAATALYGSRAANGVVLITTKSGKQGKGLGIEVNSSYEGSDILRLPAFQNEFGMGWNARHTLIENGSWGPKMDDRYHLWGNIYDNSQKLKPFVAMKDNVKDFFEYGQKFQNSVSFSGQNEQTKYYASFSQVNNNGLIPGNA